MTQLVDPLVQRRHLAHGQAVRTPWATVVETLSENLGNAVVAVMAGVTRETVSRWADANRKSVPNPSSERRLRDAYAIYADLVKLDSPHTVRSWFIGSNPYLGDSSPVETIAADDSKSVFAAAREFRDAG